MDIGCQSGKWLYLSVKKMRINQAVQQSYSRVVVWFSSLRLRQTDRKRRTVNRQGLRCLLLTLSVASGAPVAFSHLPADAICWPGAGAAR